jgi:hypothetical protein
MFRSATMFLALAAAAAPAGAASYSAKLATPTTGRLIVRDIVWNCGPAACQGATDESRPLVLCQTLAKRAGPVTDFLFDGRTLPAAELHRCNGAAKRAAPRALAAQ